MPNINRKDYKRMKELRVAPVGTVVVDLPESGETEVKKDKKWANEEIKKERNLLNDKRYEREVDDLTTGVLLGLKKALNILDQLDEPEVLSQEWIDEYSYNIEEYWEVADMMDKPQYAVSVENLQNLLVPKQEVNIDVILDDLKEYVKEQQSLSINVGMAHTPAGNDTHYRQYDFVLECIGEYEPSEDLKERLVPKQELSVIPKFVAYVIEAYKSNSRLTNLLADLAFHGELAEFVEHEDEDEVFEWARSNRKATDEILARAWLDGFTVEKEQKYYAKVKGWGVNGNDGHVYYSGKFPLSLVLSIESVAHTKDEWKNYGVYEDNADFVKVEELEE